MALKSTTDVTAVIIDLLIPYKSQVHTMTADNGREFSLHEKIAKSLDVQIPFAHPYSVMGIREK
nr:hypothetical protein [Candidatus Enterovibrio escacola]